MTSLHVLLALLGFRSSPDQSVHAPAHAPREDAKEGEAGEAGKQKDEKEQKDAGAAGRNGDDPDQVGEGSAILDAVREGSGTINFPRYMLRKMTRPSDYAYVFQKYVAASGERRGGERESTRPLTMGAGLPRHPAFSPHLRPLAHESPVVWMPCHLFVPSLQSTLSLER